MVLYADTSALVRAYFVDEDNHEELRSLLFEGDDVVVTSELARLEFTSATLAAARAGRIRSARTVLARFDADCGDEGPLTLIALEATNILPEAHRLLVDHALRTLDAIHLAVALIELPNLATPPDIGFVSRDETQAAAAAAEGLTRVG
ncbi:MAG: type II toxin-antitoxin system VapC family toxin [Acidimicrobiia bacterium]